MFLSHFLGGFLLCALLFWSMQSNDVIELRSGGSSATIHRYAAHVTSFLVGGQPVLFLSKKAVLDAPPTAIRGGIPIIWPQFSDRGALPKHGFARNVFWTLLSSTADQAVFELNDSEETRKIYPGFRVIYTVQLQAARLVMTFRAEAKEDDLQFTFALHTYFQVDDIAKVKIHGLQRCKFQNHLNKMALETEGGAPLVIGSEVDRTYLNVPNTLSIETGSESKVMLKTSTNMRDAVVWNPWSEKIKGMADLDANDFHRFVCVEVGNVNEPIRVAKGSSWEAMHEISLVGDGPAKM